MPVKMKPTSVIKVDLGIDPNGRVHKFFTNTCYKHMDKYVPKSGGSDGGNLRETVSLTTNTITYEMPYAHYQYIGMREDGSRVVRNYTTPGTGPYWDKRMVSAEINNVIQETQEYMKRGG